MTDIRPALERLPENIRLLSSLVDGMQIMLEKAESLTDPKVQIPLPFVGLFWLYLSGINDLLKSTREDGKVLWNAPVIACICRSLIEAYINLFFFVIEEIPEQERSFRTLLWYRHSKFKSVDIIKRLEENENMIEALIRATKDFDSIQKQLITHPFISTLSEELQKKMSTQNDKYIFEPIQDIWNRSGLPKELYVITFRYLSQWAHATPYAVDQLRHHKADEENGAVNMNIPVALALACSCKVTETMGSLAAELDALIPQAFYDYLQINREPTLKKT